MLHSDIHGTPESFVDDMKMDALSLENGLSSSNPSDLIESDDPLEYERFLKWAAEEIASEMSQIPSFGDHLDFEDDDCQMITSPQGSPQRDNMTAFDVDDTPLPEVPCPICKVHGLQCQEGSVYCPRDMYVIQMEHPQTDLENVREVLSRVHQVSSILYQCIFSSKIREHSFRSTVHLVAVELWVSLWKRCRMGECTSVPLVELVAFIE